MTESKAERTPEQIQAIRDRSDAAVTRLLASPQWDESGEVVTPEGYAVAIIRAFQLGLEMKNPEVHPSFWLPTGHAYFGEPDVRTRGVLQGGDWDRKGSITRIDEIEKRIIEKQEKPNV